MSEMSIQNSGYTGLNRAGSVGEGSLPGRSSLFRQWGPYRHPTTVRTKWYKNVNKIVMDFFLEVSLLMMTVSQLEDTDNK